MNRNELKEKAKAKKLMKSYLSDKKEIRKMNKIIDNQKPISKEQKLLGGGLALGGLGLLSYKLLKG